MPSRVEAVVVLIVGEAAMAPGGRTSWASMAEGNRPSAEGPSPAKTAPVAVKNRTVMSVPMMCAGDTLLEDAIPTSQT